METTAKQRILQICDELGEDLDSPQCRALREYVQSCPNCHAFVDSVKKTIRLYQGYSPECSEEVHRKLFKILNYE